MSSCLKNTTNLAEVVKVCVNKASTQATPCDCAVVAQGGASKCQKDAKQLNALTLAACASKLPRTFNVDVLKAADSECATVLSSTGMAVPAQRLVDDLAEECLSVQASGGCSGSKRGPESAAALRCSSAGKCAAKVIDALECTNSCSLDVVHYVCPNGEVHTAAVQLVLPAPLNDFTATLVRGIWQQT